MRQTSIYTTITLLAIILQAGSGIGIPGGTVQDRIPENGIIITSDPPPRGDLVLTAGEVLRLTGSKSYHSVYLGENSTLILESCDLDLEGDGVTPPEISGFPRAVYINDSRVDMRGMNGRSLMNDQGDDCTVDMEVGEVLSMNGSHLEIIAGLGYYTPERGAYYERKDISGYRFSGGNASLILNMSIGSELSFADTTMRIISGGGGDAPDGDGLDSNSIHRSGGYTLGGNVSGNVGTGGDVQIRLEGSDYDCSVDGLDITSYVGSGGNAGNAGDVKFGGDEVYDYPTPSGGYTSGYISEGNVYPSGTVSGDVGCGGDYNFSLLSRDLDLENFTMEVWGSNGGGGGDGGSCLVSSEGVYTRTRGGGGGGGYAGGLATIYCGVVGGDVLGRVGSTGSVNVSFRASDYCFMENVQFHLMGGDSGTPGSGGTGGGVNEAGYMTDGGGGGGGGFSGGSGGAAVNMAVYNGGGEAGYVSPDVSSAGDIILSMDASFLEARGHFNPDRIPFEASGGGVIDGTTGEVGAEMSHTGGGGGKGGSRAGSDGSYRENIRYPAPVPESPVDGAMIRDLSTPFEWSKACGAFYWLSETNYTFRLLSSPDVGDVLSEIDTDGRSVILESDPGDGHYWWTVSCLSRNRESCWAMPRSVFIDREDPVIDLPPSGIWVSASDPLVDFGITDNTTGVGVEGVQFRAVPAGETGGEWEEAEVYHRGGIYYGSTVVLPGIEGDYDVWVRVTDRAGNGPVLGGPVRMGTDSTPPEVGSISPSGPVSGDPEISFEAADNRSGMNETVFLELISRDGRELNGSFRAMGPEGDDMYHFGCPGIGDGVWDIYLTIFDAVGNFHRFGPVMFTLDRTGPRVELTCGMENKWLNSTDRISGILTDLHSEVESAAMVIGSGTADPLEKEVNISGGTFSTGIPLELGTGVYELSFRSVDSLGNEKVSGPWDLLYDEDPPEAGSISARFDRNISAAYVLNDDGGGCSVTRAELLIPGPDGYEVVESVEVEEGNGHHRLELDPPEGYPVVFLRIRSEDRASNTGDWSSPSRIDIFRPEAGLEMISGSVIGPDENISLVIRDPLGIKEGSLRYRIGSDWKEPDIVEPEMMKSRYYQGVDCPARAMVEIDPVGADRFSVELRWEDSLGEAGLAQVRTGDLIRDVFPPVINVNAKRVSSVNPVRINVSFTDPDSAIREGSLFVEVGGDETDFLFVPDHEDIMGWTNGTIILNVTWGVEEEITVGVRDRYGNVGKATLSARANRPPVASIAGGSSVVLEEGETITLESTSFDPDGDPIEIVWMESGEMIGQGVMIEIEGTGEDRILSLVVSDGYLESSVEVNVTVPDPPGSDHDWIFATILAMGGILIIIVLAAGIFVFLRSRDVVRGEEEISDGEDAESWEDGEEDTDKKIKCGICMRPMTDRNRSVKCRCGERFHRRCAKREGICPECGREVLVPVER